MTFDRKRQFLVFGLLVTVGVAGRFLFRDIPNFTPTAAVAIFAGYYFRRGLVAALVPLAAMMLSNLALPTYQSPVVQVVVYAAMLLPVLLGRILKHRLVLWRF